MLILDSRPSPQDWKDGRSSEASSAVSRARQAGHCHSPRYGFCGENFERVIIMAHGQVLADGTAKEVFAQEEALKKARLRSPM